MKAGVIRNLTPEVAELLWNRVSRKAGRSNPCPIPSGVRRVDLAVGSDSRLGWGSAGLDERSLENWSEGSSTPLTIEDFL